MSAPASTALAKPLTLMLVCGEPSGDALGAELMMGLRALAGDSVRIVGVGGPAMTAQGLQSLFPLDVTAVMGLKEVVPRIPQILRHVREAADYALNVHPDAVVLIDSPDFTHRIARAIKRRDPTIRTVNYVAPQVWASRQYRARLMSRYFDLVLALLPFEAPFFEQHGLHSKFVGHPVIERRARMVGGAALRERLGIAKDTPVLTLLPGSRVSEVTLQLPVFRETVALLKKDIPGLVCILPKVPHVRDIVREMTLDWPAPLHLLIDEADKFAAFRAGNVALACSGTVTTELALAGTPMAVTYKVGWLTAILMRPFVAVEHATLVNILLGRAAIPEFIQHRCRPELIAPALLALFRDEAVREEQKKALNAAVLMLGEGDEAPSLRAARALLDFARSQ